MPLLLSESDVSTVLRMEDLVDLMEHALAAFSSGRVVQPVRTVVPLERHRGFLGVMPGYHLDAETLAVKVVSVAPGNTALGKPTHLATILLVDPVNGGRIAIMDGRLITEMRTAAVSAASARALSLPAASTLAILGSGVQARSHLEALRLVRNLARVRVWSPNRARCEAFAREMGTRFELAVEPMATAEAAVRGAELVVTATAAREPILHGEWLSRGAHVMAIGACRPDAREIDGRAVARSRVFADSLDAARVEAGDLILAASESEWNWDWIAGEIGAVFSEQLRGREEHDQITLFESLGLAVEDAVTARLVFERAIARGVGQIVEL